MASDKIAAPLAEMLAGASPEDVVDVVIELTMLDLPKAPTRKARLEQLQKEFKIIAAPVAAKVNSIGGKVTGQMVLGQAVRASVPAHQVPSIGDLNEVLKLTLNPEIALE